MPFKCGFHGNGHLLFHFFGRPRGVLGDDLDQGRRRIGIRFDVEFGKRVDADLQRDDEYDEHDGAVLQQGSDQCLHAQSPVGGAQQRRSRSDDLIAVFQPGGHHDCFAAQSPRGHLAPLILSGGCLEEDIAGGTFVNDCGRGQDKFRRGGASNGEIGEHFGLEAMPGVGQDHAHLEGSTGGVHGIGDIGNLAVQRFARIGREGHVDGLRGADGTQVALKDIAEDPDGVEVGDGGDRTRVVERTLHFTAGRSDVEHRAADGCAQGRRVR